MTSSAVALIWSAADGEYLLHYKIIILLPYNRHFQCKTITLIFKNALLVDPFRALVEDFHRLLGILRQDSIIVNAKLMTLNAKSMTLKAKFITPASTSARSYPTRPSTVAASAAQAKNPR